MSDPLHTSIEAELLARMAIAKQARDWTAFRAALREFTELVLGPRPKGIRSEPADRKAHAG